MKKLLLLTAVTTLLLAIPTKDAEASSGSCIFTFWGEVYDKFDNVVWRTHDYHPEFTYLGENDFAYQCVVSAEGVADWFSYHVCLARSAGVEVVYQGEVYFGDWVYEDLVTILDFPDSCQDDWGLNFYNTMVADEELYPDIDWYSPSGDYRLLYQQDGNLVVYGPSGVEWALGNTSGNPGFVAMQGDGNLVIYDGNFNVVWASNSDGHPGAYLAIRDSGQLVVYDTDGTALWISHWPPD